MTLSPILKIFVIKIQAVVDRITDHQISFKEVD